MITLPVFVSVLLFSLSVRAGDIGWLTVRGPLEDRALTYAYGEPLANNNLMDLNGQMTWSTPFVGYKGGDTIRYDMMLSTGSEGKFDSFTYVQCRVGLKEGIQSATTNATFRLLNPGPTANVLTAVWSEPVETAEFKASCKPIRLQ